MTGARMLDDLLGGAMPTGRFGHRQHLEVALAAIERFGQANAELILRGAIHAAAAAAGAEAKYHDTITRFWCQAVGHARSSHKAETTMSNLIAVFPHLDDKDSPQKHWSSAALDSAAARSGWLTPDLAPLPWAVTD